VTARQRRLIAGAKTRRDNATRRARRAGVLSIAPLISIRSCAVNHSGWECPPGPCRHPEKVDLPMTLSPYDHDRAMARQLELEELVPAFHAEVCTGGPQVTAGPQCRCPRPEQHWHTDFAVWWLRNAAQESVRDYLTAVDEARDRANRCFYGNHAGQIDRLQAEIDRLHRAGLRGPLD
jgi:hypothetical protein